MAYFRLYHPVLAGFILLGGCASFDGAPKPLDTKDLTAPVICPTDAEVTNEGLDSDSARGGLKKAAYRDARISTCIAVIDRKFAEFLVAIRRQRITTILGGDLTLLTLTGIGAVASKGTANALSAASTGVVGARVAIDKDLYFEQTLPALEAAMETNRSTVLLRIRTQQAGTAPYSLADARTDIRAYEAAGGIDNAIKSLTATAAKAESVAVEKVALVQAAVMDKKVFDRKHMMTGYIRILVSATDVTKLKGLAKAFGRSAADRATPKETAQMIGNDLRTVITDLPGDHDLDEAVKKIASVDPDEAKELTPP